MLVLIVLVGTLVVAAIRQNRSAVKSHPSALSGDAKPIAPPASHLTSEGGPKQDSMVSPSGNHVAYHDPFDPYKKFPEPLIFRIADTKEPNNVLKIPVAWPARYVSSVQWIDDGFVLVRGEEAFLAILNARLGKQTHSLVGYSFAVSPDKTKIVYRYDLNPLRGDIPPAHQSDYVLFTSIDDSSGSRSPKTNYKIIYPDSLPWGALEQKLYSDLDGRHHLNSDLVWSPNSQMIAFVERNQRRLWLTILKLEVGGNDVSIDPMRLELGTPNESKYVVSWNENKQVKVSVDDTSLLIDLVAGTVTSLP